MERPNTAPLFLLFLMLGVIMPLVFYTADRTLGEKKDNYLKNGHKVVCTVNYASCMFNTSTVAAVYIDEKGKAVQARAVLKGKYDVGKSFEGYVLPSRPYEIFSPKDNMPPDTSQAAVAITTVMGWLMLILYMYINGSYNMLLERGKETDAELMSVERWDSENMLGSFVFENENGKIRTVKLFISRNLADVYEKYKICYYETADGRIEAATADERLHK